MAATEDTKGLIEALNEHIIIDPENEEEVTAVGLAVSNTVGQRTDPISYRGKVVGIPKEIEKKVPYKLGETVVAPRFESQQVHIKGHKYIACKQEFIIAKL